MRLITLILIAGILTIHSKADFICYGELLPGITMCENTDPSPGEDREIIVIEVGEALSGGYEMEDDEDE